MLCIAGHYFDPHLIVFDKDGTLISFQEMWQVWFELIMQALASQVDMDRATQEGLAGTLGYELGSGVWDPLGPLTLASTKEVALLMASQLYRYQHQTWDQALAVVAAAERHARASLPLDRLIRPIGDVRTTLVQLRKSGPVLALATTDDREQTEQSLKQLGIGDLFATTVCGDDGIPNKPAPAMALEICRRLDKAPGEAMMVGDTIADMTMARRAGFAHAIAVASGALPRDALAPHADLVIDDIHEIRVVSSATKGE